MRENKTCPYQGWQQMPTEELDQILQAELEKEHPNEEVVLPILHELEDREKDIPVERTPEVLAILNKLSKHNTPSKQSIHKRRWLAGIAAAAAVVCIVVLSMAPTAQAESLFDILFRWTSSVFEFFTPEQDASNPPVEIVFETDNPGLQQLYDKVTELGVTELVVPMWLPEGFVLSDLKERPMPGGNSVHCKFENDSDAILITYRMTEEASAKFEKENSAVEVFEAGDVSHFIMDNDENLSITWTVDGVECSILTCIDREDVYNIEKCILKAVYRYERLRYEYDNLCDALEKAQIPFLPLKGSVIRKYYPEAWMRTSCDIDILVCEDDIEKAKTLLVDEYGYKYHGKGSHDISLFAPTNTHVELHYDLVEDGIANESSAVLKNVWNYAIVREGFGFWHEMPDEMFYFYHIAHMAKHFENGGCGIRPFIDLCILDAMPEIDTEKRNTLLEKGNLLKFADVSRKVSRVWFANEDYDLLSKQMENYILRGGVYGNSENRIMVQQQKKGGRFKYALSKIFIPYDVIKFHYPILQKHRWLTPIMEVRRWCKLIFCGHLKRTTKELKYNSSVGNDEAENTRKFLTDIGL